MESRRQEGGPTGALAWIETAGIDRWAILMVAVAHLGFFPFFPGMNSANEISRLYLIEALVVHHDVEITEPVAQYGWVSDRSVVADTLFSDKPPGTAFLAAPFVALRQWIDGGPDRVADLHVARIFACALPTLLLLLLLRLEMKGLGVGAPARALCLATYGLGTLAFPYSILFYGHQPTAVFLYATWFLLRRPIGPRRAAAVGAVAAACVSIEYQSAVYLLPLAIVFVIRARPLPASIATGLLGAAPVLALTGLYHEAAFGAPWRTGYSYVGSPFFALVHAQGFLGVKWPQWEAFEGSLLGASKGLLFFSPFLGLGFLGLPSYGRRLRELAVSAGGRWAGDLALRLVMIALPVLFVSSMVYWDGGWTVSQRHLTPLVPFLIAPAAVLVERSLLARAVAPGLAAASVLMIGLPTVTFPHLPEHFANPVHDLTVPLLKGGCLGASWLALAVGAAFLVLLVAAVSAGIDRLRVKVETVALLAIVPLAWFLATGTLDRITRREAAAKMSTIVYFCKSANLWDDLPKPPEPRPASTETTVKRRGEGPRPAQKR